MNPTTININTLCNMLSQVLADDPVNLDFTIDSQNVLTHTASGRTAEIPSYRPENLLSNLLPPQAGITLNGSILPNSPHYIHYTNPKNEIIPELNGTLHIMEPAPGNMTPQVRRRNYRYQGPAKLPVVTAGQLHFIPVRKPDHWNSLPEILNQACLSTPFTNGKHPHWRHNTIAGMIASIDLGNKLPNQYGECILNGTETIPYLIPNPTAQHRISLETAATVEQSKLIIAERVRVNPRTITQHRTMTEAEGDWELYISNLTAPRISTPEGLTEIIIPDLRQSLHAVTAFASLSLALLEAPEENAVIVHAKTPADHDELPYATLNQAIVIPEKQADPVIFSAQDLIRGIPKLNNGIVHLILLNATVKYPDGTVRRITVKSDLLLTGPQQTASGPIYITREGLAKRTTAQTAEFITDAAWSDAWDLDYSQCRRKYQKIINKLARGTS